MVKDRSPHNSVFILISCLMTFLILFSPIESSAEYKKLTKDQREKWAKPREIKDVEKAAEKNKSVDYFGKMSQDKLKYFKMYGCPDVIGVWNCKDGPTGRLFEEWIYYTPALYVYFYADKGDMCREEKLSELDKSSINGKVEVGMDEMQVKRAKGKPPRMDQVVDKDGADEKWTYNSVYVWFKNGKVIRVQK